MKKHKGMNAFIGVFAFVLIVIIVIGALTAVAPKAIDDTPATAFLSEWMTYIKGSQKVTSIVMPGSHDAGTIGMMWMAKCQDKSVADQLACGSRYIDLRIKKKGGELVINHSAINGQKFEKVINEINDFMCAHPSEFLLLDFNSIGGEDGCEMDAFNLAMSILGDKVVHNDTALSNPDFVNALTLDDVRGKCLILWGEDEINDINRYVFVRDKKGSLREGSVFHSYYSRKGNTRVSDAYISKTIPKYISLYKEQNDGFFLLQAQLTDPIVIIGPKLLEATHDKNMSAYINGLKDSEDLQYINIIMRDFVGARKNCEIIALNFFKGTVDDVLAFSQEVERVLGYALA